MLRTELQAELELLKEELDDVLQTYASRMRRLGFEQEKILKGFAYELERLEVAQMERDLRKRL